MNLVLKKIGMLAVTLLTYLCASAYDFDSGGIYYNITDPTAKEVEVTSGDNQYSGDITVPSTVSYNSEEYTVTTIGESAFKGCYALKSIVLPNSVTTIGNHAFSSCSRLSSVILPSSLTTVGDYALAFCSGLKSITSLATTPPECAKYTFSGTEMESSTLYVPAESVDAYKQAPVWSNFVYIYEVGSVRSFEVDGIYYNVTDKGARKVEVAKGASAYTGDIVVPATVSYNNEQYTVTAIGENTFAYCSSLASINLPNTLTTIGGYAFWKCSLTSINLPNSLTTIGEYAFQGCSSLASITLSSSLATIGNHAFEGCASLTSITSLAVTPPECGESVFEYVDAQNCTLYVPAESLDAYKQALVWRDFAYIEEIGAVRSFEVDGIYYNITDKTANEVEVTKGENEYSGDIVVPSTVSYKDKQYTVTAIGDEAFSGCRSLTSVTLPNTVTTIGNDAFSSCNALTSINVDTDNQMYSSVDGILYNKSQTNLICCPGGKAGKIIVPNTVTTIGDNAFSGCNMTTITLPDAVTTIGNYAFSSCWGLKTITSLAVTPPVCAEYTFYNLNKEKCTLYVPAGSLNAYKQAPVWEEFLYIEEVGGVENFEINGIYYKVTNQTAKEVKVVNGANVYSGDIVVPATVTYENEHYTVTAIGDEAFSGCRSLTSVTLPNTVTAIGNETFRECSALTSIAVDADNQVYSSVDGILYDKAQASLICCPEGKAGHITVPNTVTTIKSYSFRNCMGLTSITLSSALTTIEDYAFLNCINFTSITSLAITPPNCNGRPFRGVDMQNCTLYVPAESVDAYKQALVWKEFAYIKEIGAEDKETFEVDGIYYNVTDPAAKKVEVIKGESAYTGDITVPATVTYNDEQYTVTAIADGAFAGCSGLTSITSLATVPPVCAENSFEGVDMQNCTLYVPAGSVDAYKQADGWKNFLLIKEIGAEDKEIFEVDGIYYNITDPAAKEVEVIKGESAYTGDITVPATVTYNDEQYTVAAIGDGAFAGCSGLTSITSLATVPPVCAENAFEGVDMQNCTLYVPAGSVDAYKQADGWKNFPLIKEIGGEEADADSFEVDGIYYNVTDKTAKKVEVIKGESAYTGDIVVPESVTYNDKQYTVTAIADKSFLECGDLKSVILPKTVTEIRDYTFYGCDSLATVTLPEAVTTIGKQAFAGCFCLSSIAIPGTVTSIGDEAFANCSGLTSIDVDADNQVYSSVDGILYDKAQTSLILCPAGIKGDVLIPNTVTTICDHAFAGCSGLTSVTLPEAVTTIGDYAFSYCYSLTTITLPASVTTVGKNAFAGCSNLTSVTSLATVPPVCGTYAFDGVNMEDCTLYVPAESVDAYKQAPVWKEFGLIEDNSSLGIGSIDADTNEDVEVFSINGAKVSDTLKNLPAGIYIVRNGSTVRKVVVR